MFVCTEAQQTDSCSVWFTAVPNPANNLSVEFLGLFTGSATEFVYSYEYQGVTNAFSDQLSTVYTFLESGVYTVCLQSIGSDGCVAQYCLPVTVNSGNQQDCSAAFTMMLAPNSYTLQLQGTTSNTISPNYSWNVLVTTPNGSDVFTTTGQTAELNLPISTLFAEVCLFVIDTLGDCSAFVCDSLILTGNNDCFASFIYSGNGNVIQFTHNGSDDNIEFTWDFGDNSPGSNMMNPIHTYAQSGLYIVTLTTSNGECTSTYTGSVFVNGVNTECDAGFTYSVNANPMTPGLVSFAANQANVQGNAHYWLLNNQVFGYEAFASYVFPEQGVYTVCHIIENDLNFCLDTFCLDVIVSPVIDTTFCNAAFDYSLTLSNTGDYILNLFALYGANNNTTMHYWTLSNGITLSGFSATAVVPEGELEICHFVEDDMLMCSDTSCSLVNVGWGSGIYSIGGEVWVGNNQADVAKVFLITYESIASGAPVYLETNVTNGVYTFDSIPAGAYLIKASLQNGSAYYSDYVPTYFGSQYYWFNAQMVVVDESDFGYNISMIFASNTGGPGTVNGNVINGPVRIMAGASDPVAGADVIVTDVNGAPQRWAQSNQNGGFSITNLAFGTYQLMADVPGFESIPLEFTISEDFPTLNITFQLGDHEITAVIEYEESIIRGELFPNPSSDVTSLRLSSAQTTNLYIQITTLTGQVVSSRIESAASGLVTIPVSDLTAGMYFVVLQDNEGNRLGVKSLIVSK